MKLQGVSVLFALIVLPLILVLSYYIRLQVETINLQNQYDAKLLNSTRDALSAFEINTANEDLSSVSDSLRTIIEASSNVFINTLATNLGMSNASKSYIEPYVPSLLYTLYDGYYIYAPTRVPTVLTDADGNAVSVGDAGVTVNGDKATYSYTVAHSTKESEDECEECAAGGTTHIKYANYSNVNNYMKYSEIDGHDAVKYDYGQILYVSKDDPTKYTTDISKAELKTKNVLKAYMPYSARYKKGTDFDISVVYTLDNYITIEGNVGNVYYTKSGYLLPMNCYRGSENKNSLNTTNPDLDNLMKYSQEDAKNEIEKGNREITLFLADGTELKSGGAGSYESISENIVTLNTRIDNAHYYKIAIQVGAMSKDAEEVKKVITDSGLTFDTNNVLAQLEEVMTDSNKEVNRLQYELDKMSAMTYYVTGIIFTDWVQSTLDDVQEQHLIEISGQEYRTVNGNEQLTYKFDSESPIFMITGTTTNGVTDIPEDSVFYTHKLNVIRNSIQYNLNLAMSTYNNMTTGQSSYAMPVMENEEWQKILTNPSIVSFLQGYHCGLKTYNNYMIVSSTNNEISVSIEDIYYVDKEKFSNESSEYHKIDCPKLTSASGEYIAFTSKEAKYDKVYNKHNSLLSYRYDHKNYACYECVNDGNYEVNNVFPSGDATLKKAYYIGVGKCKNNLYKMNAIDTPQGYEIIYNEDTAPASISRSASLPISKIKAIEVVVGTIKTTNPQETVLQYRVGLGNGDDANRFTDELYSISSNVVVENTILVRLDPNKTASQSTTILEGGSLNLYFKTQAENSTAYTDTCPGDATPDSQNNVFKDAIKYVRIIYK